MRKRLRYAMPRVPLAKHREGLANDGDENPDINTPMRALHGTAADIVNNVGKTTSRFGIPEHNSKSPCFGGRS